MRAADRKADRAAPAPAARRRLFQGLEKWEPISSKAWKTAFWVAFTAWGGVDPAGARVFRLFGGGGAAAEMPGWNALHRAEIEINGGRAELMVMGVTLPAATALETLRAAIERESGETAFAMGDRFGWGMARIGDRILRVLVLATEGPRECLVFRIEQSRAEFERSQRGAAARPPDDVVAGARTTRRVADRTHEMEARSLESPAGPAETTAAIERALLAEGWQPALPGAAASGAYLRGDEMCFVRVVAAEAPGGGSRALIVRKRLRD